MVQPIIVVLQWCAHRNAECCGGIFASIVHLPSNCIISIRPLACFYTMQEALMVCHRNLQARAVRPPQRRWSRLPPDAGSELAAGAARAAKRMRLRCCSAVAVRPLLMVASWSTRGATPSQGCSSGSGHYTPSVKAALQRAEILVVDTKWGRDPITDPG